MDGAADADDTRELSPSPPMPGQWYDLPESDDHNTLNLAPKYQAMPI